MNIHILVLNYNGQDLLEEFLPSVAEAAKHSPIPCALSVIDNASQDESRAWVRKHLPAVGWIPRETNTILYAYNDVARMVKEDFILLLNNDIKVDPNFIGPLFEAMRARPDAFCASPRHLSLDGHYNGGMNRCGRRGSLPWAGPFYPDSAREAEIPGETLFTGNGLFRRDKFLELGGFDKLYRPMGWEDTDLCTRAWGKGWPSLYVPSSTIFHKSSASLARAFSMHRRRSLGFRNAILWFVVHAPLAEVLRALAWLPFTILACLFTARSAQLDGLAFSLFRLPQALARRATVGSSNGWRKFFRTRGSF